MYRRFTYWSRRGVPSTKFIELGGFFNIHHDHTKWQYDQLGPIYGTYSIDRKAICINDPDLLRDIMVKDFHIFPDHKHFHMGSSKIGKSLFFLPGNDDWKRVRSILSPTFTSGKLRAMMSHISDISDKFVDNLKDFEKRGIFDLNV